MSHKGHDNSKCGVNHHPCHTLSYTLEQRANDDDVIEINGQDGTLYPMKKQHLVHRNITLIGTEGRARIAGEFSVVGSYLFADVARGLNTSPEQVIINLVNLNLIRIGIIKLKNTLTTLNIQVVNCTVSKLSKSPIVDSSAAKTTVIFKKSIIRHVSKGLQVKSREFSLSIESSTIDNSGGSYPGQDCPQFIVIDDFESLVAHFSKSLFKYTFLIHLAASRQKKSNVSIIDSIFDDDSKNVKHNGCFSAITLRNTTALIVNSTFTNIISRKSLIIAIASFVTFKECIFSNISSKLGMFSLSSSIIPSYNKTNAINNNKLNGFNYGSLYLQSTKGIFQNCTFHNNTVDGRYGIGGAVYIHSSIITVQQCLFKKNTATYGGGAINIQKARGSFVNCTFDRNSVKNRLQKSNYGGAISVADNSHLPMYQCSFKDNTATGIGGATYIQKSQSLFESCIFERNKVNILNQDIRGGAISAIGAGTNITMKQCLFKENTATYSGGAVYIQESQSLFESCIFERNKVNSLNEDTRGGAISANSAGTNITIKQCLFKENTATYSGGAINMRKAQGSFVNCTFDRNSVKRRLQKSNFGGAICVADNSHLIMHQCSFKDNTATGSGGATYIQKSQSLFESCIFERNKVNSLNQDTHGGAISATGAGTNITIKQCLFKENTATYLGGATYINKSQSLFESCIFEGNKVNSLNQDTRGGAISAIGAGANITIKQCLFKENTATYSGGAAYIETNQSLFESCIFEGNKVNSLNQDTRGGAISAIGACTNITIKQCLFKGNTATYSGDAAYIQKSQSLFESCIFERNKVNSLNQDTRGGAISAIGACTDITIKQCLFKENTATYLGGATYINRSQSLFESCIFEGNKVNSLNEDTRGGAISAFGAGTNITIKQCLFKENTATYLGGATYINKYQSLIENCSFERNKVNSLTQDTRGGAISATGAGANITIKQCLFKENTATYLGGAAYILKSQSLFESCIFERNKVNSLNQNTHGGAISAVGAGINITIKQCLFKENTATNSGGAADIETSQSLFESCIFERNKVNSLNLDTSGGAISANASGIIITIKQCLFKENAVTNSGEATAIQSFQSLLLRNSTFVRKAVKNLTGNGYGGAIHLARNSYLIVLQCLFKENTATYSGGAISMQEARGSFENCTFIDNAVQYLQEKTFGGAISFTRVSFYRMTQCLFKKNNATFYGGACYIQKSQGLFENCTFEGKV